ncbi:putative nuclease HARBI1 [Amphibalanus amphitrite]|uniref:putative nuclease HARBI1 n=1 Tax=Amphibalanus amphitrite TaxID=1232801 RepID=UPI001C902D57|nr:putative nuclease HARBI1 [Amphibalanus amphitrite]
MLEAHAGQRPAILLERNNDFFEETVPNLTEQQYREQFRLSRATVAQISNMLGRQQHPFGAGKPPPPREKQILLTLWYLGSVMSLRKVAMLFGVSTMTALKYIAEVTSLLADMHADVIRMPETAQEQENVSAAFETLHGLPCAVGALDGCHIPMNKPVNTEDSEAFVNRKGFYSINLLAVCDAKRLFRDICVGWPGSVHDSRIFRNSSLGKRLMEENFLDRGKFLIADAAFQLQPWLMTPFRENQNYLNPDPVNNRKKKHFNKVLSSTRVKVEHGFGLLKARFRRLTYVEIKSVEKATKIVVACCVLHNLSMQLGDQWEEDNGLAAPAIPEGQEQGELQQGEYAAAAGRRAELVEQLWLMRT